VYKEAMNNVLKHSGASAVEVNISKKDNLFQLEVKDNGRWKANPHSSGTGSRSMRERARHIGGTLEITEMQTGTSVMLIAPIP
jgi:two-component system sensor histidine kinase UhpB